MVKMFAKLSFILFPILLSLSAFAVSAGTANFEIMDRPTGTSKSYFIFVNLNSSLVEQEYYRAAAKENGSGFISIPNSATVQIMAGPYAEYINLKCEDQTHPGNQCQQLDKYLINAADAHPVNLDRDLPAVFNAIKGQSIKSIVLSGHNSDGGFSGDYLVPNTYSHDQIAQKIKQQTAVDPDLFIETIFLGLWGCDSVTLGNSQIYTAALPNLSVIGGFGDTAPSGVRPASGIFMRGVMNSASSLVLAKTKVDLMKQIHSVQGAINVYGALWVKTLKNGTFIYRHSSEGSTIEEVTQSCENFMNHDFENARDLVEKYNDGILAIPTDRPGSPLREVYYDLTSHSTCYNQDDFLSPVQVGMLRFIGAVKENFVLVFQKSLSPSLQNQIMQADRRQLIALAQSLSKADPASRRAGMLIQRYLLDLDDSCFDFLLWHEKRDSAPAYHCSIDSSGNWLVQ